MDWASVGLLLQFGGTRALVEEHLLSRLCERRCALIDEFCGVSRCGVPHNGVQRCAEALVEHPSYLFVVGAGLRGAEFLPSKGGLRRREGCAVVAGRYGTARREGNVMGRTVNGMTRLRAKQQAVGVCEGPAASLAPKRFAWRDTTLTKGLTPSGRVHERRQRTGVSIKTPRRRSFHTTTRRRRSARFIAAGRLHTPETI